MYEKLTQRAPSTSVSGTNTRSRLFAYDKLDRLLGVKTGALDTSSTSYTVDASDAYPSVRRELWNLDLMGNWAGVGGMASGPSSDPCASEPVPVTPGEDWNPFPEPNPGIGAGTWYATNYGHEVSFDGTPPPPSTDVNEVFERHHPADAPARIYVPAVPPSEEDEDGVPEHWVDQLPSVWMTNLHANSVRVIEETDPLNPLPLGPDGKRLSDEGYTAHRADPNGNTVFDGEYFYQYDAWNRLVQVNKKGTLEWYRFPYAPGLGVFGAAAGDGSFRYFTTGGGGGTNYPAECPGSDVGELVKHFTYDGVGRLARTSSPVEAPDGWEFEALPGGPSTEPNPWFTRSERFIYDGVRRIQEIVTDPVMTDGEGNRVATMSAESEQRGGSHGGGGGSGEAGELPEVNEFLRAQYVWGPGDNGVDELLCQIEPYSAAETHSPNGPQGKLWFILTDGQGDVVSIASVGMGLGGGSPMASVAGQWTYSPYGEVLTYDQIAAHPEVVFGHKSLAIDRLDAPALTWENESEPGAGDGALFETRRLEPGARLLAYARNRTLDITRGRWLQDDPNQTGAMTLIVLDFHGKKVAASASGLSVAARAGDGMNLFGYCGSNSISNSDPSGLFFSLPGMMMTGLDAMSNVSDQFDEAASGLRTAFGLSAMLDAYQFNQELTADLASDWNSSDDFLNRIDTSGADSSFLAEAQAAGIAEFNQPELLVADAHRIIPGLAGGTYDPLNVADLPTEHHQRFHSIMAQKFRDRGLNPPNAQGKFNWRTRFEAGEVTSSEKARMRRAITDSAVAFDAETRNKYNLRERTRVAFKSPHVSSHLKQIKRGMRGLRR